MMAYASVSGINASESTDILRYSFGVAPNAYGTTYKTVNGRMPQSVPFRSHFNCCRTIGSSILPYRNDKTMPPIRYGTVQSTTQTRSSAQRTSTSGKETDRIPDANPRYAANSAAAGA